MSRFRDRCVSGSTTQVISAVVSWAPLELDAVRSA
jgi:hypothetical protein